MLARYGSVTENYYQRGQHTTGKKRMIKMDANVREFEAELQAQDESRDSALQLHREATVVPATTL